MVPEDLKDCEKPEDQLDEDNSSNDEEDKENTILHTGSVDKPASGTLNNNNNSPTACAKLVLEKSLSISLFPDAPTTPKVCRKMVYDDEDELKEIVKKYQSNEHSPPVQKFPTTACCDDDDASNDCALCHKKKSLSKPPTLELDFDKGIIC